MMQDKGTTVPKAAVCCNITRQSAYMQLKDFNSSDGSIFPGFAPKAKNKGKKQNKKIPRHTLFLIECIDSHKSTTLG